MKSVDLIVVGGGMVGLSAAIGAAQLGYQVALVDAASEPCVDEAISNRVSAVNHASQAWLEQLGAWPAIVGKRACRFESMQVWQSCYGGELRFDGEGLGVADLGHIVENQVICWALYEQARTLTNITCYYNSAPVALKNSSREAWLTLADGQMLGAQLIFAADGANSWCRAQAHLPLTYKDYGHHALVATVEVEKPHQNCARQAFTQNGPLAFLPLQPAHICSIVWSLPPEQAMAYQQLSAEDFGKKLTAAFDAELGCCTLVDEISRIPLTMRYARHWLAERLVLMGDAAHTIHPLAGQGVNLGFADAKAACDQLALHAPTGPADLGDLARWRPYERARKTAAVEMLAVMEAIKQTFCTTPSGLRQVVGLGMQLLNRCEPAKELLIRRAMGL